MILNLINLYHLKVNNVKLIFFLFVFIMSSNLSFSQVNSNKIKTIVIDPGHGGKILEQWEQNVLKYMKSILP